MVYSNLVSKLTRQVWSMEYTTNTASKLNLVYSNTCIQNAHLHFSMQYYHS